MSLTVGTTLQNGKFVVEAMLHQSDFGVTYQAAHSSINRPIILQSFNEVLRQRSDFDPLRQKFLQEVLLFSKQPSDTVQVIDCFEENGMPFVVLESTDSNQAIPYLSDWLEIPIEASIPAVTQPTDEAIANAEEFPPVLIEALATSPPSLQSFPLPSQATNGYRNGVTVLVSEQSAKPKKWMPLALMMTALIAGFSGAGLGLALRLQPAPQGDNPSSSLSSGWFGREQSFPPQQEWPITETPNLYPPSSTFEQSLDQPNDQPSPLVRGSGTPRVQPSTGYIPSTGYTPPPEYIPPAQLAPPDYQSAPSDYQPAPPGIADYPPIPDTTPFVEPATPTAVPPAPEAIQPIIPLPQPITPQVPIETLPEINKPPSSSKSQI